MRIPRIYLSYDPLSSLASSKSLSPKASDAELVCQVAPLYTLGLSYFCLFIMPTNTITTGKTTSSFVGASATLLITDVWTKVDGPSKGN